VIATPSSLAERPDIRQLSDIPLIVRGPPLASMPKKPTRSELGAHWIQPWSVALGAIAELAATEVILFPFQ
jgi:hypothetical protein